MAKIDVGLLEAFSRGEITRREIEDREGEAVSFGTLLGSLHEHGLPLPRIPSDPNARGVQLIKQLVLRAVARAG